MSKERVIIGLDASSSEIGICIWSLDNSKILQLTHKTLGEKESVVLKGDKFKQLMTDLHQEYDIVQVGIEEAFVAMYGMSSSAHTTALLNQVNAIYQYIIHSMGIKVSVITPHMARKLSFPNVKLMSKSKCGMSEKEQIFVHVCQEIGETYFPTKVMTRGKNKGEVRFEDWCTDMSDAYVICKAIRKNYE